MQDNEAEAPKGKCASLLCCFGAKQVEEEDQQESEEFYLSHIANGNKEFER